MCSCILPLCLDGVHFLKFWSLKAWFAERFFSRIKTNESGQLSHDGHGDWANHLKGYFEGSDQKITISNILSLSFGLIGLFLVVHGLIRKKFNSKKVFISKITLN